MTLSQLIPALRKFKKVIVTGPQRSGTTIAAKMLAAELKYPCVLEETFREENIYKFVEAMINHPKCVVQAPALSSVVHLIKQEDIAVVFMMRRTREIRQSEQRIKWLEKHDGVEKNKYFRDASKLPISTLKRKMWKRYQKPKLGERAFQLDYKSLASHPLWVEKDLRKGFGPRQTA